MNSRIGKKLASGLVSFIYCMVPVIQDHYYTNFSDRVNDNWIFFVPSNVYGFMQLVYTNSLSVYLVQLILWLLIWVALYWTIVLVGYILGLVTHYRKVEKNI